MSKTSALNGRTHDGAISVQDFGLQGMITLRGDLSAKTVKDAVSSITGATMPEQRGITRASGNTVLWMSPDEVLLLVPHEEADDYVGRLCNTLKSVHHLAVNISDARCIFEISGQGARNVLARLAPVDLHPESFGVGEIRRTRLAQVPAAFWMEEEGRFRLICFRSVADYVFGILTNAASSPEQDIL